MATAAVRPLCFSTSPPNVAPSPPNVAPSPHVLSSSSILLSPPPLSSPFPDLPPFDISGTRSLQVQIYYAAAQRSERVRKGGEEVRENGKRRNTRQPIRDAAAVLFEVQALRPQWCSGSSRSNRPAGPAEKARGGEHVSYYLSMLVQLKAGLR